MISKKSATTVFDRVLMWGSFALFLAFEAGMVYGFLKLCGRI